MALFVIDAARQKSSGIVDAKEQMLVEPIWLLREPNVSVFLTITEFIPLIALNVLQQVFGMELPVPAGKDTIMKEESATLVLLTQYTIQHQILVSVTLP